MCALRFYLFAAAVGSLLMMETFATSTFPDDIPRCHFGELDCIAKSAMRLLQQYGKTGYAAAGFPTVEPFMLKRFDISDGRESSVNLKLGFRDVKVEGLSGAKFDRIIGFERDPSKSKFEMHGSIPRIEIRCKYNADGRILILPIKGDGDADIVLTTPKFSVKFKPAASLKNGKTYLSVDKLKVLVEPEKMNLKLENLFNGDATLGKNLNEFLNENWHDVWSELQPSIHLAIAEICKNVLRNMFTKFAYDDIFLED